MESIPAKYAIAAIMLIHSYVPYRTTTEYFKRHTARQRTNIHVLYGHPDDHRLIAAEIRRMRAYKKRLPT